MSVFFFSHSWSTGGDRFHLATYEYLQSSNLLVATCSMFRIVFSQLMNTFLPPYAIAGWGKNCGASQNKIMTGLGEIITGQAGRQAWMCMTGTWREAGQYIFLYFQKKILYNRSPRGFMLNSYTFWRFCDWRWDTMNRLPLVRQKSGSSIQIFHRLCRFSATLFSQMEMWCLCINYVFSCHSMAHSWFCAGKVSHERKDDHLRLGWRLKNL